jgi:hypothetical protein
VLEHLLDQPQQILPVRVGQDLLRRRQHLELVRVLDPGQEKGDDVLAEPATWAGADIERDLPARGGRLGEFGPHPIGSGLAPAAECAQPSTAPDRLPNRLLAAVVAATVEASLVGQLGDVLGRQLRQRESGRRDVHHRVRGSHGGTFLLATGSMRVA